MKVNVNVKNVNLIYCGHALSFISTKRLVCRHATETGNKYLISNKRNIVKNLNWQEAD